MHEMSIAVRLVEMACEKAAELGDVRVRAVRVRLGRFSGVVKEALVFSFDVARKGTAVQGARLEVEDVPLTVRCPRCDEERPLPGIQSLRCPVCGTPAPEVVRGRELELVALEVTERAAADR